MPVCLNLIATTVFIHIFFQNLNIIQFEKLHGNNPIFFSASLADYKNNTL